MSTQTPPHETNKWLVFGQLPVSWTKKLKSNFLDRAAESAALTKAAEFGLRRVQGWQRHRWELTPSKFPSAVRSFASEGWRVEAEGKLYRRAGSINIEVRSGIDWFELDGRADFEGAPVAMPELPTTWDWAKPSRFWPCCNPLNELLPLSSSFHARSCSTGNKRLHDLRRSCGSSI
jgi:hypothetical protein